MQKTYQGSCHCGAVRFEADIDLALGTIRCNCSICSKGRYRPALVAPAAFRLAAGSEALSMYQFGAKKDTHPFCRHCGVRAFGTGRSPRLGDFVSVNLGCLDDASAAELAAAPITYLNGRDDIWDAPPAVTCYL
jgi:hypothetical protein